MTKIVISTHSDLSEATEVMEEINRRPKSPSDIAENRLPRLSQRALLHVGFVISTKIFDIVQLSYSPSESSLSYPNMKTWHKTQISSLDRSFFNQFRSS